MNARIQPEPPPWSEEIQSQLDRVIPPGVPPLSLFTTLARDERLFSRFMSGGLLDKGHLTLRQREIIIDRVRARCGSEYEWGIHVAFFADKVGLTPAELSILVHDEASGMFATPEGNLLVDVADALLTNCAVDDEL